MMTWSSAKRFANIWPSPQKRTFPLKVDSVVTAPSGCPVSACHNWITPCASAVAMVRPLGEKSTEATTVEVPVVNTVSEHKKLITSAGREIAQRKRANRPLRGLQVGLPNLQPTVAASGEESLRVGADRDRDRPSVVCHPTQRRSRGQRNLPPRCEERVQLDCPAAIDGRQPFRPRRERQRLDPVELLSRLETVSHCTISQVEIAENVAGCDPFSVRREGDANDPLVLPPERLQSTGRRRVPNREGGVTAGSRQCFAIRRSWVGKGNRNRWLPPNRPRLFWSIRARPSRGRVGWGRDRGGPPTAAKSRVCVAHPRRKPDPKPLDAHARRSNRER